MKNEKLYFPDSFIVQPVTQFRLRRYTCMKFGRFRFQGTQKNRAQLYAPGKQCRKGICVSDIREAGSLGHPQPYGCQEVGSRRPIYLVHITAEVRGERVSRTSSCGGSFLFPQLPRSGRGTSSLPLQTSCAVTFWESFLEAQPSDGFFTFQSFIST